MFESRRQTSVATSVLSVATFSLGQQSVDSLIPHLIHTPLVLVAHLVLSQQLRCTDRELRLRYLILLARRDTRVALALHVSWPRVDVAIHYWTPVDVIVPFDRPIVNLFDDELLGVCRVIPLVEDPLMDDILHTDTIRILTP